MQTIKSLSDPNVHGGVVLNPDGSNIGSAQSVYTDSSFQATITTANATSPVQVKAGTGGANIYVTDFIISTDTAMNIQLQDNTGTPVVLMEQVYFPANSIFSKTLRTYMKVPAGKDLNIISSASGNISVFVSGYVV